LAPRTSTADAMTFVRFSHFPTQASPSSVSHRESLSTFTPQTRQSDARETRNVEASKKSKVRVAPSLAAPEVRRARTRDLGDDMERQRLRLAREIDGRHAFTGGSSPTPSHWSRQVGFVRKAYAQPSVCSTFRRAMGLSIPCEGQ